MEKSSAILVALVVAILIVGNNSTENISELNGRIGELELDNSEKERIINEKIVNLQERDVAISELEATVLGHESNIAGLEAANALMEEQRDSLLAQLSDSQEFANQTLEFANQTLELVEVMNETIAGITVCEGDSVEVDDDGHCVSVRTINCFQAGFCDEAHSYGMGNGTSLCGDAALAECATEEQYSDYYDGVSAFQWTGYHLPQQLHASLVGNMCGSN